MAAVGVSLQQSSDIVMGYPLTILVPHAVGILLTKTHTQYMTHNRLTKYEQLILAAENVNICGCLVLNPTTLMPMPFNDEDSECEHDCLKVTELCTKPRPGIRDVPLAESNSILFVDGSCLRD